MYVQLGFHPRDSELINSILDNKAHRTAVLRNNTAHREKSTDFKVTRARIRVREGPGDAHDPALPGQPDAVELHDVRGQHRRADHDVEGDLRRREESAATSTICRSTYDFECHDEIRHTFFLMAIAVIKGLDVRMPPTGFIYPASPRFCNAMLSQWHLVRLFMSQGVPRCSGGAVHAR